MVERTPPASPAEPPPASSEVGEMVPAGWLLKWKDTTGVEHTDFSLTKEEAEYTERQLYRYLNNYGEPGVISPVYAADLLARVAKERDEAHEKRAHDMARQSTVIAFLRKRRGQLVIERDEARQRAEAAEKGPSIANKGGLDLLYAIRKAIGWTDKHALSLLPDECARLKKAAARNAPLWPGEDFDHSQSGGFDGPTGAD